MFLKYEASADTEAIMEACMSVEDRNRFAGRHSTADRYTLRMEKMALKAFEDPDYNGHFFLGIYQYSNSDIHANNGYFTQLIAKTWGQIIPKRKKGFTTISLTETSNYFSKRHFGRTVHVFFDPNRVEVQRKMESRYGIRGMDNKRIELRADRFFYECLANVYGLEILQVKRRKAINIFKHCVAFLFQTIRAKRQEGPEILVSAYFLPFYHGAFHRLAYKDGYSEREIKKATVPWWVVRDVWGTALDAYLSFDNWGKKHFLNWRYGGRIRASTLLFQKDALEAIKKGTKEAFWKDTIVARQYDSGKCSSCAYQWFERPGAIGKENCCAAMCMDIQRMSTTTTLTQSECCGLCNESRCSYKQSSLSTTRALELVPYGYQLHTTLSVMI